MRIVTTVLRPAGAAPARCSGRCYGYAAAVLHQPEIDWLQRLSSNVGAPTRPVVLALLAPLRASW